MNPSKQDAPTNYSLEQKILSVLITEEGVKPEHNDDVDKLFAVVKSDDFSRTEYTKIFEAAKNVWLDKGFVPDLDLRLRLFKEVGGEKMVELNYSIDSILDQKDTYPASLAVNLVPDLKRLKIERELPAALDHAIKAASREEMSYSTAVEKFISPLIEDNGATITESNPTKTAFDTLDKEINAIETDGNLVETERTPLGFNQLDFILRGGLRKGQLFILGARPATGKTTLALNFTLNVLRNTQKRVAFVSLEQTAPELAHKLCAAAAGVQIPETQAELTSTKKTNPRLGQKLREAFSSIDSSRLHIIERTENVKHLVNTLAKIKRENSLDLVVIDYLQLIPSCGERSRYEAVTNISVSLKKAAKELDVPVICLAQVNRNNANENRAPRLSDLRDSGAIEQDADIAALLYDAKVETEEEQQIGGIRTVNLDIQKNRAGACMCIKLNFAPRFSLFTE